MLFVQVAKPQVFLFSTPKIYYMNLPDQLFLKIISCIFALEDPSTSFPDPGHLWVFANNGWQMKRTLALL